MSCQKRVAVFRCCRIRQNITVRKKKIMVSNTTYVFLLILPLLATLVAWLFGIGPLHFWSTPVAAGLPWLIPLGVVLIFAKRVQGGSQDAAIMLGMFPILAGIAFVGIAFVVSFFLGSKLSLFQRFIWPLVVSAVPAVLMAIGLLVIYLININESKKVSAPPTSSGVEQSNSEPDQSADK